MSRDSRDLLEIGLEIYSSSVSSGSCHESASRAEGQMVVLISIASVLTCSSIPASGPPFSAVLVSMGFGFGLGFAALTVTLALALALILTCSR